MKRILLITVLLISVGLQAQQRQGKDNDLKPEEMANLQAKKTTLALALNKTQQEKVYSIYLQQAKARKEARAEKEKMKNSESRPSKEMKLKMANARLDAQIEMQNQMKAVLTSEQFEKWQKMKRNRKNRSQEGRRSGRKNRERRNH